MLTRQQTHSGYRQIIEHAEREGNLREVMRRLLLEDLFFLLVYGFGRKDADKDWLYERCREVQREPDGRLDLWSREHYKSTIITYAKTVQDILNDPEITIGIFSFNRPIAKAFLRQIKYELETNVKLKHFFPEILWENPRKDAPKWSEDSGIIVQRKGNPKEATVEAWGLVDGQPTSKHYKLMIYDDVVTRESVTTPEMIAKVTEAWELSRNLTSEGGATRYIGTRYHFNDTYKAIIDREAAIPRIYPATADGKVDGKPVLLTAERLADKRREMGPYTFACQMMQDPKADDTQGFKEEWLKFWHPRDYESMNLYILVDPAGEKRKTNDYTSMFCVGQASDKNFYVVDMVRDRMNLTERTNTLFAWHRRYQPVAVGYEKYGMQSDIEHIKFVQEQENYRFDIKPLAGQTPKNDRIKRLIPVFEQGRIYMPFNCIKTNYEGKSEDLVRIFINDEYKPFPVMLHDDMLDCLARIQDTDFPMFPPTLERPREKLSQAERDWEIVTGQINNEGGGYNIDDF